MFLTYADMRTLSECYSESGCAVDDKESWYSGGLVVDDYLVVIQVGTYLERGEAVLYWRHESTKDKDHTRRETRGDNIRFKDEGREPLREARGTQAIVVLV